MIDKWPLKVVKWTTEALQATSSRFILWLCFCLLVLTFCHIFFHCPHVLIKIKYICTSTLFRQVLRQTVCFESCTVCAGGLVFGSHLLIIIHWAKPSLCSCQSKPLSRGIIKQTSYSLLLVHVRLNLFDLKSQM